MSIDSGVVAAACALASIAGIIAGWVGKHFVRDVVDERSPRRVDDDAVSSGAIARYVPPITASDLEAALARCENRLLEKFNGRYPSKDVFNLGMKTVADQIIEIRKYIGDVERRVSARIDQRVGAIEGRVHDIETQ